MIAERVIKKRVERSIPAGLPTCEIVVKLPGPLTNRPGFEKDARPATNPMFWPLIAGGPMKT